MKNRINEEWKSLDPVGVLRKKSWNPRDRIIVEPPRMMPFILPPPYFERMMIIRLKIVLPSPCFALPSLSEKILTPTRAAAPNAQIDLIEGNHEARVLRQLADATPALRAVLADFHGMTLAKLFKLDELEINYVAKADLGAYNDKDLDKELRNNYRVYYDTFLAYHFPDGRDLGLPGCNGHHHKHIVWPMYNRMYGAYEWHQLGAGHKRSAEYCLGEKWHNGFAIVHIDTATKSCVTEYIQVTDFAVVGGKYYYRDPSEY
jgi:hypothetical protein